MNIGYDAKRAFFNGSGLGNYSRSTIDLAAKYFPANNYFLFTPPLDKNSLFDYPINSQIVTPKGFLNNLSKSYWRTFKIKNEITKHEIDIYHGLTNELPHNSHKSKAKLIVTVHDLIFIRYPELYSSVDRKIYLQKFKYACDIAHTVIAISEQTKTDIINFFGTDPRKIDVVYQTCNPIFYKEAETAKKIEAAQKYNLPEKYILNVGTVERRKNALSVLKAINEYKIDVPLIIVGKKTNYQDEIEKYATDNKISEKLIILNSIPACDLPALYQQAEMLVYPSVFEGFGIPVIEALFSKIPVITTKGGCFSEAGGQSTIYTEFGNTEELASAIKELLIHNNIRQKIIDDGYKYVQNFAEDKVAANLMNIYIK